MYESTQAIAEWIKEYVKRERPNYVVECIPASGYIKVSILSQYEDHCISRVGNQYFTLNKTRDFDSKDPLFDAVKNKNKNHWEMPIKGIEDVQKYKKYFLIVADYLYKTYEIEKYPYNGGDTLPNGMGISVGVKF